MAKTIAIVGPSGEGKSTGIRTLDPKSTFIINADGKSLPFRNADTMYNVNTKNYVNTSSQDYIKKCIQGLNKLLHIKTIVIDTANAIMLDIEMSANFRSRKAGGEAMNKWMDLAAEIYDLICECNDLREDLVIFICFHATLYTDIYGNERKCIVTNGRKLEKIHLESKFPLVLYTHVKYGGNGKNEYFLETQANSSTGKTPMEMFDEFLIPNDFALIDSKVREYYGIK